MSLKLEWITWGRSAIPSYLGLARINWDHFGEDARAAYNAGHATAIQKAISGDLEGAYTLNAFADHFLEDSFPRDTYVHLAGSCTSLRGLWISQLTCVPRYEWLRRPSESAEGLFVVYAR